MIGRRNGRVLDIASLADLRVLLIALVNNRSRPRPSWGGFFHSSKAPAPRKSRWRSSKNGRSGVWRGVSLGPMNAVRDQVAQSFAQETSEKLRTGATRFTGCSLLVRQARFAHQIGAPLRDPAHLQPVEYGAARSGAIVAMHKCKSHCLVLATESVYPTTKTFGATSPASLSRSAMLVFHFVTD